MEEWKTKPEVSDGRKEKGEETMFVFKCAAKSLSFQTHCAQYLIQGFCQECVAVLLPFPLWSRAVQEGWLVGWLHRKGNGLYQTADGGQHVLTLQKKTHAYACTQTCTNAILHTVCENAVV